MNWRIVILTAGLTGLFCAGFAVVVDAIFDLLSMWAVIAISFCSGFCGSVFAQSVLRNAR